MAGRLVHAADLLRLRWAMEPAVAPDGELVAYVVSGLDAERDGLDYKLRCHEVASGRSWRLGPREGRCRRPRWSPDGRRLAFLCDLDGTWQPWLAEMGARAGPVPGAPLARLPGQGTALDWSPDGRQLAVSVEQWIAPEVRQQPFAVTSLAELVRVTRGHWQRTAWLVAIGGERPAPLGEPALPAWAAAWSPRGDRVAFLSNETVEDPASGRTALYVAPGDGHGRRYLIAADGPISSFAWAPDGSAIAYLGHRRCDAQGENQELWLAAVDGRAPRCLSAGLDRSVGLVVRGDDERGVGPPDLCWAPDGKNILAAWADGGRSLIGTFGLDGRARPLIAGDRAILQFSCAAGNGRIAFAWSDPTSPGELSIAEADGSAERRISALNSAWRAGTSIAPTHTMAVAVDEATTVEVFVTDPPDPAPSRPVVIQVHGGPHYPVGLRFSFDAQRLAALGFRFVRLNPRGSQGYGAAFARAIRADWGGCDLDDLLAVRDAVLADGECDPARVALIGESYGGYLVEWAIARSDRFAAAVAENGISDLFAAALAPQATSFWRAELTPAPWDDPVRLLERSPIFHVSSMRTPLLLVHAELDDDGAIAQSERLFVALLGLGRQVEFVRLPEEGHWVNLFGSARRRLERSRLIDAFLVHQLADDGAPDS